MATSSRPLAVITGASSGIGFHLAQNCIEHGFDIIIAADMNVEEAARTLEAKGGNVESLEVDLGTEDGVDELVDLIAERPVAALLANAGHGLGRAFLQQDWDEARDVIDTNVAGTAYLVHQLAPGMVARREGRILFTGSVAGFMPGTFQAIYNGTKAFVDSFSWALRNELQDTGVTVTCLMPGPTDTNFFARADMLDTKVAQGKKDDPADVAKIGFEAMMAGEGDVVAGFKNKVEVAVAHVTPAAILAEQHRRMAEPGTGP
ncbi:MAG TPA: SDR family NAD(P)-dependent oxidoreductase [Usitatibacter sp.]|jgi:short-subunit dehydrogenase|nr:SDR family NAD(P)-dependent oxidoreductase [Usitatibacter sp.]